MPSNVCHHDYTLSSAIFAHIFLQVRTTAMLGLLVVVI